MPFNMQQQEQDQWCWAAVAVSVERYFAPSSHVSQCQMASEVLNNNQCCADPGQCNVPVKLQDALEVVRKRTVGGPQPLTFPPPQAGPLSFPQIKAEINRALPVCVRIGWDGGGGHFVVIAGYRQSASVGQIVEVADPMFGDGRLGYDEFSNMYLDSGRWTNTFLVQV